MVYTRQAAAGGVESYDTTAYTYTLTVAGSVVTSRPMNPAERAWADAVNAAAAAAAAKAQVQAQLSGGIAAMTAARAGAQGDVAVATSGKAAAVTLKAQLVAQRAGVAGFVPSVTYKASDIAAIQAQLVSILDTLTQLVQASADGFDYRAAVDNNAVLTDSALIGLAQIVSGELP